MSFQSDLAKGKQAELAVQEVMGGEQSQGEFKEYDLKVEVKRDISACITGNVAIELAYKGEPSGWIEGSDVLVYDIGGKLYSTRVEDLKDWLANNKKSYKVVMGGDGKHSQLALIKLYWFMKLFNQINI